MPQTLTSISHQPSQSAPLPRTTHSRGGLVAAGILAAAVTLAGCSTSTPSSSASPSPAASASTTAAPATTSTAKVPVVAGFYPLAYAAQRVGGDAVDVVDLTKPGAEPHDAEPTTADVATVRKSRVILTVKGFQPAVDALVAQATAEQKVVDATTVPGAIGNLATSEGVDLHFWLDPTHYSAYVAGVADALAAVDPARADTYRKNADALRTELTALDTAYSTGLATCQSRTLVTGHEAFGYLAKRYGLTQVGIAGLNPDQEPTAKQLAAVADTVRTAKVGTIYSETLVDAKFAQTVASSTGAKLAVLDPVEGISTTSAGSDYLGVMRSNLETLRLGQGCA